MMDVTYKPIGIIYTGAVVLFGAFFSVNLILAVMV
jgi:hypothetical protein